MGPFDQLWNWLQNEFWEKLRGLLGLLFGWLVDRIQGVALLFYGVVAAFGSFLLTMVALGYWAIQQISESLADIDISAVKAGSATLLQYGAFINRFVPLVEGASMAIIVFNIWLAVTILRWIKSFIPTISN